MTLEEVKKESKKELFKVVSLFAGGGGSSTGYRMAGGKILAINEFVPAAQEAYHKNYPETTIFKQDVRELNGANICEALGIKPGELDILDGSPPCASFSMAGARERLWGEEKSYSGQTQKTDDLFYEYARILKELQPRAFIAENVKGLSVGTATTMLGSAQTDMFGAHEDTIYHTLVKAGYNVRYKVLNAADYGVPQARERLIFIGLRKDLRGDITFPVGSTKKVSAIEATYDLNLLPEDLEPTWPGSDTEKYKVWPLTEVGGGMDKAVAKLGKKGWFSKIRFSPFKPCPTITTKWDDFWHWNECRNFTIKELKRFFSFPDDYYLGDRYSKQYERLGRSVPPLMMKAVAEHVYYSLLTKNK
jgi:DNA (cytosine-5)-methyltransferase 1